MSKINNLFRWPDEWNEDNPVLGQGQVGKERGTNKIKVGDGVTAWTYLSYVGGSGGVAGLPTPGIEGEEVDLNTLLDSGYYTLCPESLAGVYGPAGAAYTGGPQNDQGEPINIVGNLVVVGGTSSGGQAEGSVATQVLSGYDADSSTFAYYYRSAIISGWTGWINLISKDSVSVTHSFSPEDFGLHGMDYTLAGGVVTINQGSLLAATANQTFSAPAGSWPEEIRGPELLLVLAGGGTLSIHYDGSWEITAGPNGHADSTYIPTLTYLLS